MNWVRGVYINFSLEGRHTFRIFLNINVTSKTKGFFLSFFLLFSFFVGVALGVEPNTTPLKLGVSRIPYLLQRDIEFNNLISLFLYDFILTDKGDPQKCIF